MKMHLSSAVLFLVAILGTQAGISAPLGTIPRVDTEYLKINADLRSDIWTSPQTYKKSPVRINSFEVRVPLAHGHGWNISANLADESLSLAKAEFPLVNKDIFVGNNLQSQSMGLGFYRVYEDTSAYSIVGSYASASDMPYADLRNRYFEGMFTYRSALYDNHRWVFALSQTNNRGIANGRPFPYLGVLLELNENLEAWVGVPFLRLIWKKPNDWKRQAEVTPFGAFFDIEKNLDEDFLWHARFAFNIRSYLYENRIENASRLYFQEMTLEGGIRKELSTVTTINVSAGYAFDRKLYESDSLYSPRHDKTPLDSDLFARVRLEFTLL